MDECNDDTTEPNRNILPSNPISEVGSPLRSLTAVQNVSETRTTKEVGPSASETVTSAPITSALCKDVSAASVPLQLQSESSKTIATSSKRSSGTMAGPEKSRTINSGALRSLEQPRRPCRPKTNPKLDLQASRRLLSHLSYQKLVQLAARVNAREICPRKRCRARTAHQNGRVAAEASQ
ncbi:uncharacterized protein [Choristoneura fumiferana]|uniref:uncharacterized protein n=1 Tax=Choristoneura fumiferana TaxID=7141 RepID=UPI003D15DD7D